jgi:hypothetical protein
MLVCWHLSGPVENGSGEQACKSVCSWRVHAGEKDELKPKLNGETVSQHIGDARLSCDATNHFKSVGWFSIALRALRMLSVSH